MDDRRFDSLVKSLARGASRRSVLKGMLGLSSAAVVGGTALEGGVEAARRPTPTPRPVSCPGVQTWNGSACICPVGLSKCGPDCCNDDEDRVFGDGTNNPNYTECCDNACCQGKCFGEELCCPYTQTWCEATGECCPADLPYCCGVDGCCATPCCETVNGLVCCAGETPRCCPGDICISDRGCCADEECLEGFGCIDHQCTENPSPECAGETCETFTTCSTDNPNCVCASLYSGGGLCVPGNTLCDGLALCPNGDECEAGALCAVNSCCVVNVCVPIELECVLGVSGVWAASPGEANGLTIGGR